MSFKRAYLFWIVAVLLAGAGAVAWMQRGAAVELTLVSQGPMLQSVVTSGRIAGVARTDVMSQSTARIEQILVQEGDAVQAGQVLVRLRDDEASANLQAAQAAVAEAEARLRQLGSVQLPVSEQQLAQARAAAVQAEQELVRAQDLLKQGFISQARLDDALRLAQTARAAVLAASAQTQSNQTHGAEAAATRARLAQARAGAAAAATRLDNLSLRAPVAATVISRNAEPGDTAQPGHVLLTLVSGTETRIETSVDEKNLKVIRLGQVARASADAYPDQPFAASLSTIAPAVDAQRGTVDLKLRVTEPPAFLRPDMTVSVEIITAQAPDALRLSTDALRRDPTGKTFVLLARDGKAIRAEVTLGLQGIGTTQILTGLANGDTVILPTTSAAAGDRVRPKSEPVARGNAQPIPGLTQ
ncbi:MAG: efflux RND transporter periplasmic adaptor subunit [Rhodoferax sp.]|nr:efflux RND transporter periplasmic adaptor subunit [Rhodoferax sp.]